uniref:SFRICE_004385 n=1 Tax=Spodoptera frugiperda TaxID=7108 RepID=A0A2H1W8X8_SPOFR
MRGMDGFPTIYIISYTRTAHLPRAATLRQRIIAHLLRISIWVNIIGNDKKMHLKHTTILLALISTSALSQNLPSNAMTFLETMIPKNPGQSITNVMDSIGNMVTSNMPIKVNRRYAIIGNTPTTLTQNQPTSVLIQNLDTVSPKSVLIQEMVTPKSVLNRNGVETVPRQVIIRNNDLPTKLMVDNNDASLRMIQRNGQQTVLVQPEYSRLPQKQVLFRDNNNMLLSRPSPVAQSAPMTAGSLPSATPQPRSKISRKFPIPPPTF